MNSTPLRKHPSLSSAGVIPSSWSRLLVMASLLWVAGCGADARGSASSDGTGSAGTADASVGDVQADDDATNALPPRLRIEGAQAADATIWLPVGAYLSRQHFATRIALPPLGTPAESVQTALVLHQVRHEGGKVLVETRACAIDEPAHNGVQTVFPDALLQSLGSWTAEAKAWTLGDGSAVIDLAPTVWVYGCTLTSAATEALPTQADDPRLTDPDADGHPGGTVRLEGLISGSIYVVQRNLEHLRAVAGAPGNLDGLLLGDREQRVVGASEAVLATFDLAAVKHEDAERSDLVWRPLPSGDTCKAVLDAAATALPVP